MDQITEVILVLREIHRTDPLGSMFRSLHVDFCSPTSMYCNTKTFEYLTNNTHFTDISLEFADSMDTNYISISVFRYFCEGRVSLSLPSSIFI